MSAIDYATVKALNELYERRQRLQRSREECREEEWWYDALARVGNGTGARSSVIESLGGQKSFAALVLHAAQSRFESMQADIDKQIADLGGRP